MAIQGGHASPHGSGSSTSTSIDQFGPHPPDVIYILHMAIALPLSIITLLTNVKLAPIFAREPILSNDLPIVGAINTASKGVNPVANDAAACIMLNRPTYTKTLSPYWV